MDLRVQRINAAVVEVEKKAVVVVVVGKMAASPLVLWLAAHPKCHCVDLHQLHMYAISARSQATGSMIVRHGSLHATAATLRGVLR